MTATDDEQEIRAAQQRLQQRRADLGIRPPTPAELTARADFARRKLQDEDESLLELFARGMPAFAQPPPDAGYERMVARTDAAIPDRYHGVRWSNLATLRNPKGEPSLSGVLLEGGARLTGGRAVRHLRPVLDEDRPTVLIGRTRAGKSLTAAAFLDGLIRSGAERPRWASAEELGEPGAIDRAVHARTLVLDGVGEDLHQAPVGSPLNGVRCAAVAELVGTLARLRGKRLVVTTWMDFDAMAPHYGGNVASRVFEGAAVVRLG